MKLFDNFNNLKGIYIMWSKLPDDKKKEYERLILAFSSLTEMFTQKLDANDIPSPIINSKYQETVFQKIFNACAEDIGNTSYDVSLKNNESGKKIKYLVGIKTFGIGSGDQKIAQFKKNHGEWAQMIEKIEKNSEGKKLKSTIDSINHDLYLELAKKIAKIRNERIDSSIEQLKGFTVDTTDTVYSVYHVLMPSKKNDIPKIFVGETNYDKINIDNIQISGCTTTKHPGNFKFDDGIHTYKYTSADSQLLMNFNNHKIVVEEWDAIYLDDAYNFFSKLADSVYGINKIITDKEITESFSWSLLNNKGEMELFSGFNSFYGTGSKEAINTREQTIEKLYKKYQNILDNELLEEIKSKLYVYLINKSSGSKERDNKLIIRDEIISLAKQTGNKQFLDEVRSKVYRPINELYIPIPNSKEFHKNHPDFFGKGIGKLFSGMNVNDINNGLKKSNIFNLVFEPSGNTIQSFITQSSGKAIESCCKQSQLGEWILRRVFQLKEYEPLTKNKMLELEINGIRLYKLKDSQNVHIKFIWIDFENLPNDYIFNKK